MIKGKYSKRIQVKKVELMRDPNTKLMVEREKTVYECWAYLPQTSSIKSLYQAAVAHLEHAIWFEIRYKEGLEPGMRVTYKNFSYEIEDIKLDFQRKEFTLLQCKEVV
nr:phage head closure protein [Fredinandcohnia onubensis]